MRLVVDYGGVVVHHGDPRDHLPILGVGPDRLRCVALAYFGFRDGFLQSTDAYLDLLGTLADAPRDACREYLETRWLDPELPAEHAAVLRELAADHSLVCFSNGVRPWIETVLADHGVLDCFDELVVSSEIQRAKPHPRGYVECLPEDDTRVVMISDEYDEDLLMAEQFGMVSVWVADGGQPLREPDHRVDSLTDLPGVVARLG